MSKKLRAAVVGCGAISQEHLHVLATHARVDLVGVCDRSPAAVNWAAARHSTQGFVDAADMIAATHPDIVHVLTPPSTHRLLAEQALNAGAHVIVEKPIAESAAALDAMYACAHRNDRLLIENHNYRFNDQMRRVAQMQADGVLGDIAHVDVLLALDLTGSKLGTGPGNPTSHLPGGAVRDFLTHITYLGIGPFGDAPLGAVDARWWNRSGNPHIGADDFAGTVEVGGGMATVRFSAHVAPDCFRVWVRGNAASVEIDLFQPFVRLETRRGPKQLSPVVNHAVNGLALVGSSARNLKDKVLQKSPYHGLWTLLDQLIDALLDGHDAPVSESDVRRTNQVMDGFVTSALAASSGSAATVSP